MEIDEWTGITTPKGEEININIFSTKDDPENEIRIVFYSVKNDANESVKNGEFFDVITIDKLTGDIR